ncbi:hypothetical protein QBC34DRAFT_440145 [Podospora aff. communis PSN243]|uniref:Uncharacterized protein n=1 Tax=Podospora aff. communis PSN243 TaxID=3040156 RepID=A0AAV9GG15_9PEZI|nr:hypothetical protein QBC34DRAFT_440145 [Podospora aff. communis PSN243]
MSTSSTGPPASGSLAQQILSQWEHIKNESTLLGLELNALVSSSNTANPELDEKITSLQSVAAGRLGDALDTNRPRSVMATAADIAENPDSQQDIILADFETIIDCYQTQQQSRNPPAHDLDALRQRLVARKTLLEAVIPASATAHTNAALAHIERRVLNRKYVNAETMGLGRIDDIPREDFFVSEDNYAWDMSELAQALESNSGVMRNPLSREMFSEADVKFILGHARGKKLRPMQLAQSQLKRGIRQTTIDGVARLSGVLLADQSEDVAPSRRAVDEFLAYVAMLPEPEQRVIKELKIPAKDSRAGLPYDWTIGQAVADAKGNMVCFHKTGDFLKQAADYLQRC